MRSAALYSRQLQRQAVRQRQTELEQKGKSSPRIVYHYGRQDSEIRNYLLYRRRIKDTVRRLKSQSLEEGEEP